MEVSDGIRRYRRGLQARLGHTTFNRIERNPPMTTKELPSGTLLLTTDAVAAELRISVAYAKRLVNRRAIRSITIGRARRVPRVWLDEWVERKMAAAQEEAA
jgi:excisionase family DNA binding protein